MAIGVFCETKGSEEGKEMVVGKNKIGKYLAIKVWLQNTTKAILSKVSIHISHSPGQNWKYLLGNATLFWRDLTHIMQDWSSMYGVRNLVRLRSSDKYIQCVYHLEFGYRYFKEKTVRIRKFIREFKFVSSVAMLTKPRSRKITFPSS